MTEAIGLARKDLEQPEGGQSPSILVIDDEPGIRQGCRRVLEPRGFHVVTAATSQEGREQIEAGDFDLVLLDVMMPDGRGLDLLEPIRQKNPDTIAIIITGYATVELAVEAIRAGAYDFISKPFLPDMLLIAVNQGLERKRLSLEARRLQRVEKEAAAMAQEKQEAERLSAFKTAFTTKVAHELRAPVSSAISLVRPMLRGLAGELNAQQQELLGRVENRLDILMELVNDLLVLAAAQQVVADEPLQETPLLPAIQKAVDHHSVEAEHKKLALTLEVMGGSDEDAAAAQWTVMATEKGLNTILSNLLNNAIKYTPEAGRVTVSVSRQADQAAVAVSDTGIGVPVDDLARLGEEFFRATNARRSEMAGTGLGLTIVKELIELFGGTLDIQSTVGEGTTVTVLLPFAG
jgi:two-component system, sensor histidine kinase and response regulator